MSKRDERDSEQPDKDREAIVAEPESEPAQANGGAHKSYLSISATAARVGVDQSTIRRWAKRELIPQPVPHPATGEQVYDTDAVAKIRREYARRVTRKGTRGPGAAKRRQRARTVIADEEIEADGEDDLTPAQLVSAAASRWLELGDPFFPAAVLVSAVANDLDGPPVWVMFVAPPSSGKSQLLAALLAIDGARLLGKITNKAFVSGMADEKGAKKKALLERMRDAGEWLLVIKDFGTLDSLPSETRNEILGQLREIYDGKLSAVYGTGKEVDWTGRLGVLAAATPAVDRRQKWSTELGERFVQYRPESADPTLVTAKAHANADRQDEMAADLERAYAHAFEIAMVYEPTPGAVAEVSQMAMAAAEFVAAARCPVDRSSSRSSEYFQVAPLEGPGRLTKVFAGLGQAGLRCYLGDVATVRALLVRFALSSVTPGNRGTLLRLLAERPEGVTVRAACRTLRCDDNTARRTLEDLAYVGMATCETPGKAAVYYASARLAEHAARMFPDEVEPHGALRKLTDLPTDLPQEGEKKEADL